MDKLEAINTDNSEDYSEISIPITLPDLEETQIVDDPDTEREVSLFLKIKDGKVSGAETTAFVLPHRWTYDTLLRCVKDFLQRLGHNERVKRLFFKRAKGKGLVCFNSDRDVPELLNEYPTCYPSGKKKPKKSTRMYLAVEFEQDHGTPSAFIQTPRRSPRLSKKYDIFVHTMDGEKISSSAEVIHGVEKDASLQDIINLINNKSETCYIPKKGIFWLRKGNKNPVSLKTDEDLQKCQQEYRGANSIRLACMIVKSPETINGGSISSRRRKLDMGASDSKNDNELWNQIHVSLVRDLEKKGVLWRYSTKHLRLWTDMVLQGKSSGTGEEPQWELHMEEVVVPPKSRRTSSSSTCSTQSSASSPNMQSNGNLMEMMFLQNQQRMMEESKRTEFFQTALLAMMSNNSSPKSQMQSSMLFSPQTHERSSTTSSYLVQPAEGNNGKKVVSYTCNDCVQFLEINGLESFIPQFVEAQVDGPLLASLCHPSLGESILDGMGINKQDGFKIKDAIKKAM